MDHWKLNYNFKGILESICGAFGALNISTTTPGGHELENAYQIEAARARKGRTNEEKAFCLVVGVLG
jgi:hypothetical protein